MVLAMSRRHGRTERKCLRYGVLVRTGHVVVPLMLMLSSLTAVLVADFLNPLSSRLWILPFIIKRTISHDNLTTVSTMSR